MTLSEKKFTFRILDAIQADIELTDNPYLLPVESLFTMAARRNKKRSFLFVSKVLGKHLPINPHKGLVTAALLAARFLETVKGMDCEERSRLEAAYQSEEEYQIKRFIPKGIQPIIIGFAETATALGHAFFDCFLNADFFHTTREEIVNLEPAIRFEEEHSHATSHRCYFPEDVLSSGREIILVDDELTTGKTALNFIQAIQAKFPRQHYTIVSILDWRSPEHKAEFAKVEKQLGIKIHTVSLLAGKVQINSIGEIKEETGKNIPHSSILPELEIIKLTEIFTTVSYQSTNKVCYISETGRFGLSANDFLFREETLAQASKVLREKRTGKRTLCLGTGEFMYLPMKLAAAMGNDIYYQSTTRSPIFIHNQSDYGARYGFTFPNPEDQTVTHYVYNIPPGFYDEVFLFFEREIELDNLLPLLEELGKNQVGSVKVVFFSGVEGD